MDWQTSRGLALLLGFLLYAGGILRANVAAGTSAPPMTASGTSREDHISSSPAETTSTTVAETSVDSLTTTPSPESTSSPTSNGSLLHANTTKARVTSGPAELSTTGTYSAPEASVSSESFLGRTSTMETSAPMVSAQTHTVPTTTPPENREIADRAGATLVAPGPGESMPTANIAAEKTTIALGTFTPELTTRSPGTEIFRATFVISTDPGPTTATATETVKSMPVALVTSTSAYSTPATDKTPESSDSTAISVLPTAGTPLILVKTGSVLEISTTAEDTAIASITPSPSDMKRTLGVTTGNPLTTGLMRVTTGLGIPTSIVSITGTSIPRSLPTPAPHNTTTKGTSTISTTTAPGVTTETAKSTATVSTTAVTQTVSLIIIPTSTTAAAENFTTNTTRTHHQNFTADTTTTTQNTTADTTTATENTTAGTTITTQNFITNTTRTHHQNFTANTTTTTQNTTADTTTTTENTTAGTTITTQNFITNTTRTHHQNFTADTTTTTQNTTADTTTTTENTTAGTTITTQNFITNTTRTHHQNFTADTTTTAQNFTADTPTTSENTTASTATITKSITAVTATAIQNLTIGTTTATHIITSGTNMTTQNFTPTTSAAIQNSTAETTLKSTVRLNSSLLPSLPVTTAPQTSALPTCPSPAANAGNAHLFLSVGLTTHLNISELIIREIVLSQLGQAIKMKFPCAEFTIL